MIIVMNTNESSHIRSCTMLARKYNDTVFSYKSEISFEDERRITFLGHAHTKAFGEKSVSAEDFAEYLIKAGLSKSQPVDIDLLGCEIGYCGPQMDEESYAHKLYRILQEKGYDNVNVNAFVNFIQKETMHEMKVTTLRYEDSDDLFISLRGIREPDYRYLKNNPEFIGLEKNEKDLREKFNVERKQMSVENKTIEKNIIAILRNTNPNPEISKLVISYHLIKPVSGLSDEITEQQIYQFIKDNREDKKLLGDFLEILRDSQIVKDKAIIGKSEKELKIIYDKMDAISEKYKTIFTETDDIRKTFDFNSKYQINAATYQDVKLPVISRMAIIALNDRAAELKMELGKIKDSRFYMTMYGGDTKIKKIQLIEKTISDIRKADVREVPGIIDNILQNNELSTARTKAALLDIKQNIKLETTRTHSLRGKSI